MSRIKLTGLRADLPIGAMAAFGCLRVCQRLEAFRGSKLAWESDGGVHHAVLSTPEESTKEALVVALVDDVTRAGERAELKWSEQIKTVTHTDFHQQAIGSLESATATNREVADWFAAFGTELLADKDGKIDSTPFDMSVARQKFLADARKLAAGLADEGSGRKGKTAAGAYEEALFGPWEYGDNQHSLGWDPSTMKLGAFTNKAPTAMANSGVRAAVWLAFESLPLFSCFFSAGMAVPGFQRQRREFVFRWPVWSAPISLETMKCLINWAALVEDPIDRGALQARGVTALYRSARFKPNKYLANFRAPELVFGGGTSTAR